MPRGAVRCSNAHVLLCTLRFCAAILASIRLTKSILWKLAMENLSGLEKILGYEFKNKHLLQQAVTHSSHTARLSENYERLEFLGDRVLGVSIASLLYRMFPNEPEGSLSQKAIFRPTRRLEAVVLGFLNPSSVFFLLPVISFHSGSFKFFPQTAGLFNCSFKITVENIENTFISAGIICADGGSVDQKKEGGVVGVVVVGA